MNRRFIKISLSILLSTTINVSQAQKLTSYVDPFIGTAGHGHTFPGATLPFGMVQLSPDTGTEGWDWCSGYHSSDSSIIGFSHTHLSGTGGADYGDILLMPTIGAWKLNPGSKNNPSEGYRSRFKHETELASPGYYSVFLEDYKIKAELTATTRVGFHRYTFPKSPVSNIVIDLKHGISDEVRESFIQINGNDEVVGLRRSKGWADDQYVYFIIKFSKPFKKFAVADGQDLVVDGRKMEGKEVKGIFRFTTKEGEEILTKVAISSVSIEGARKNLEAELPGWDFEQIKTAADKTWEKQLQKIKINSPVDSLDSAKVDQKKIFYTALYHCFIHPNVYNDVDGQYRGMDKQIHKTTGNHYTVFSLWDTFRALHPLFTIIDPEKNNEIIQSLLDDYLQSGHLPIWELASNETGTMIGYHSVPVISDMILKGLATFDTGLAYEAMKKSAMDDDRGLKYYKLNGFIPRELENNAVSKQLEYAYDDWCIAQVAQKLGKQNDYEYFLTRALTYKNVFDPAVGFMRGRNVYGQWNPNFNPSQVSILGSGDFTEGNSWQYSFFAPQDINGMIELYGGNEKFTAKLDSLYNQKPLNDNEHALDVTGLIGQYAQGNEPSHHVAYLYSFAGQPWKTQKLVNKIATELYTANRDGLCGNEDCGQMSAWYVFSALGFYPVNPASGQYTIGTPLFESVTINPDTEKAFTINATNGSEDQHYIQSASLNNNPYAKGFISHSDIIKGGLLAFNLSSTPNKEWAVAAENRPVQTIVLPADAKSERLLFMPYEASGKTLFFGKKSVKLKTETPDAKIYYTLDGTTPTTASKLYTRPIDINTSETVNAVAIINKDIKSEVSTLNFTRAVIKNPKAKFPKITTDVTPSETYPNTVDVLLNATFGTYNFRDGNWFASNNDSYTLTIELEKPMWIKTLKMRFMQNTGSWIFLPKTINFQASVDGKTYQDLGTMENEVPFAQQEIDIKEFWKQCSTKEKIKFIKVKIENIGNLPGWHPGAGNHPWIFSDELVIEY
ncbi:GH92 family glycosyl hydrolase [Solitalea sp. MAHUQ-68]|uniref:GH92 family glycosyl hydrolase n=1 Tax=Solitalea agri TaxID=2953739 RepID=A0A9X2F1F5_9SPHI|nr:GH92 family glycosyl hydrolase [Solitalea agri]MCO4292907.1 GH92 family glycosyl hydrolase [Solitalea agri]